MPRYIDADAFEVSAHERYCAECDNYAGLKCRACWVDDMLGDIYDAPTISPDEVRGVGEWIDCPSTHIQDGAKYRMCSVCNEHIAVLGHDLNYCPNCGAKMEVSEDA